MSSASIIVSAMIAPTPLTIGAERSISARDRTRRVSTSGSPRCRNHSCTCRMSGTANIVRERWRNSSANGGLMPMRRRRPWSWGISARSALVAATVVFVRSQSQARYSPRCCTGPCCPASTAPAAARVGAVAEDWNGGAAGLDPALLGTDQRIVAVQVITPGRHSRPTLAVGAGHADGADPEIGDGLHIGMPAHESPYGRSGSARRRWTARRPVHDAGRGGQPGRLRDGESRRDRPGRRGPIVVWCRRR